MKFSEYLASLTARLGDEGEKLTDWHCHLLPEVDDGPRTLDESLVLAEQLVQCGVERVIATPHRLHPNFTSINQDLVLEKYSILTEAIMQRELPLQVKLGGEVRIDSQLYEDGCAESLAIGERKKYLLLELPNEVAVDPTDLIKHLSGKKVKVIVAHVERYAWAFGRENPWQNWMQAGAMLQVNTGSFLSGEFRDRLAALMQYASWLMAASDAHGGRRVPQWPEFFHEIASRWGEETAYEVAVTNPNIVYHQAFGH